LKNVYYRIKYFTNGRNFVAETSNLDEAKQLFRKFEKDENITNVKFIIVNELEEEITSEQLPE